MHAQSLEFTKHRICSCCRHATRKKIFVRKLKQFQNWHSVHNWYKKISRAKIKTSTRQVNVRCLSRVSELRAHYPTALGRLINNQFKSTAMLLNEDESIAGSRDADPDSTDHIFHRNYSTICHLAQIMLCTINYWIMNKNLSSYFMNILLFLEDYCSTLNFPGWQVAWFFLHFMRCLPMRATTTYLYIILIQISNVLPQRMKENRKWELFGTEILKRTSLKKNLYICILIFKGKTEPVGFFLYQVLKKIKIRSFHGIQCNTRGRTILTFLGKAYFLYQTGWFWMLFDTSNHNLKKDWQKSNF